MPRPPQDAAPPLIGQSPVFLESLDLASRAARLDRPLLVVGERGTGKELIAARVHFLSDRWDGAYVKINCAALTDSLLESELFGHEAGAFTGAGKQHVGAFERADGGTLFLDEIGVASVRLQEKILRVVEYGAFERVGGARTLSVDVRLVAATNEDLPTLAREGRFRADLLDRLAFDVITLAPLRARWEDIPILAEHFGRRMAAEVGALRFAGFAMPAMAALIDHAWPGNVRELKNVVERAVFRASIMDASASIPIEEVTLDPFASPWRPGGRAQGQPWAEPGADLGAEPGPDLGHAPEPTPRPPGLPSFPAPDLSDLARFEDQLAAFEAAFVRAALRAEDGHQGRAAKRLGLSYHQFRGRLRKIHPSDAAADVLDLPGARD